MNYDTRLTLGLLGILLGAPLVAVGWLTYWFSEKAGGRGAMLLGGALVALGIYMIFVMGGGVPE